MTEEEMNIVRELYEVYQRDIPNPMPSVEYTQQVYDNICDAYAKGVMDGIKRYKEVLK